MHAKNLLWLNCHSRFFDKLRSPKGLLFLRAQAAVHEALLGLAAKKGKKNGVILWPARIAMAGKLVTPCGAIEIAVLLGREEALRRLRASLEKLQK